MESGELMEKFRLGRRYNVNETFKVGSHMHPSHMQNMHTQQTTQGIVSNIMKKR